MQIFDAKATADRLPMDRLVSALRQRFVAGATVAPRQILDINDAGEARTMTSLLMPAWVPERAYGVKIVNVVPQNAAQGLPGIQACYILFDASTGVPVASMDGNVLTARRTAAASALAASFLARADATHLLIVGAGAVATELADAYSAVLPIKRVSIWSRNFRKAQGLADRLTHHGTNAVSVADLAQAAGEADIVSCATMAQHPVIQGRWLRPGTHLDLIGGFTPDMRESDDACFEDNVRWWIDTEEALVKSGDLLGPLQRGIVRVENLEGTLATLCRGESSGRRSADERTIFKSVGTALEDLAAGMLVADM